MKNPFYLILAVLVFAFSANAKIVNHYSVHVTLEDRNRFGNIISLLSGWTCTASTSVRYHESIRDQRGNLRSIPRNYRSNWSFSLFSNPEVTMNFDYDSLASEPNLHFNVSENCSRTVTQTRTTTDSDGSSRLETYSDTEYAYFNWTCNMSNLPRQVGVVRRATCNPSHNSLPFSMNSVLLGMVREKRFVADFTLRYKSEEYIHDFCPGQSSNRKIIRLQQGVGGHAGENDFVFHIDIDRGRHVVTIPTGSGLLSGDIAICTSSDSVEISLSAIERDLFFNDHYRARYNNSDRVTVNVGQAERLRLTRDRNRYNIFARNSSKYDSDVRVEVIDPNSELLPHASETRDRDTHR